MSLYKTDTFIIANSGPTGVVSLILCAMCVHTKHFETHCLHGLHKAFLEVRMRPWGGVLGTVRSPPGTISVFLKALYRCFAGFLCAHVCVKTLSIIVCVGTSRQSA